MSCYLLAVATYIPGRYAHIIFLRRSHGYSPLPLSFFKASAPFLALAKRPPFAGISTSAASPSFTLVDSASLRSRSIFCWLFLATPAFLGLTYRNIFLPSSAGICSTLPYSSRSLAKRYNSTSPCSLKRLERPRKNTKALTLLPSSRNSLACLSLKL